jgi:hypothetical protein
MQLLYPNSNRALELGMIDGERNTSRDSDFNLAVIATAE